MQNQNLELLQANMVITGKEHFQVEFQRACRISTEYIPSMMLILRQKKYI